MQFSLINAARAMVLGAVVSIAGATASVAQDNSGMYSEEWSRYVSAADLSMLIIRDTSTQVIDIRSEKQTKKGMIPGAFSIPFKQWRGPKSRPGQPMSEEALEALLSINGIDIEQPIVVHNHTGKTIQTGRAAIVYWALKTGGAENIAILNGGFKAWKAAELPQVNTPRIPEPRSVDLTYRYDWWADPVDIFAVASGQKEGAILDARLDSHVRKSVETGEPLQSMPMARFIPASFFMNPLANENITSDAKADFRADLVARGIELGEGFLISVCQTGELSALSWFYASEIVGIDNVLYYPDALQGWRSDGGLMFGLTPS